MEKASRTAVLVCRGRAAAHGRIAPARFADPTAMVLLRPAEQAAVLCVREEAAPTDMRQRMELDVVRGSAEVIVPRTVAIDDAVLAHPTPQLVILGAGLDGRAWRLPALPAQAASSAQPVPPTRAEPAAQAASPGASFGGRIVFEVDHPVSQRDKIDRAAALPADRAPHFVPVDFTRDNLGRSLAAAGHRTDVATTWIWEGVVPYLTREAVAATVEAVAAASAGGSRFIINYQTPSLAAAAGRRLFHVLSALTRSEAPGADEPRRSAWKPAEMATLLAEHGFTVTTDDDLLTLAEAVPSPVTHRRHLSLGRILVADRLL